jgi:hypothetical protein
MTRKQVPKGGFRFASRRLRREQLEALERISAILERLEARLYLDPGGVRGAAGHGPPSEATEDPEVRGMPERRPSPPEIGPGLQNTGG